jgi:hypothetical protein
MANDQEALAAIDALNGSEHMGRTINVAVANERPAQPATAPAPEE